MGIPKPIAYSFPTETASPITAESTLIPVVHIGRIPFLSAGEYTYGVLCSDKWFLDKLADYETVMITSITGDTLTVIRDQESTSGPKAWPAGTAFFCPGTAKGWTDMIAEVESKPSLGETATDAYRGDRGKTAYDHSQTAQGDEHGAVSGINANMIIRRDASGRARVAAPAHNDDIARLAELNALDSFLTSHINDSSEGVHGSTFWAFANTIPFRDSNGRFRVSNPSAADDAANLETVKNFGIIKQSLNGTTNRNSTSSTAFQNTDLQISFSCERSNSTLLILAQLPMGVYASSSTDYRLGAVRLINSTSSIVIGSAAECRFGNILHVSSASSAYRLATMSVWGIYSPSTTASRIYRVQIRSLHANTTVEMREDYFNPWIWVREVKW